MTPRESPEPHTLESALAALRKEYSEQAREDLEVVLRARFVRRRRRSKAMPNSGNPGFRSGS